MVYFDNNKTCLKSKPEFIARKIVEQLFGKLFPSSYPKWLMVNKKSLLELDIYNNELKLAFEYQGEQHYKYVKFFHKTTEQFYKRIKYDHIKKKICNNNGVILLEIPHYINIEDIKDYILLLCDKQNIYVPNRNIKINYKDIYNNIPTYYDRLQYYKKQAKKRYGECLSKYYNPDCMTWKCECGHIWETSPSIFELGTWCPKCSFTKELFYFVPIDKYRKKLVKRTRYVNKDIITYNNFKNQYDKIIEEHTKYSLEWGINFFKDQHKLLKIRKKNKNFKRKQFRDKAIMFFCNGNIKDAKIMFGESFKRSLWDYRNESYYDYMAQQMNI